MTIPGLSRCFSFRGRARRLEYVVQAAVILALDGITGALALAAVDAGLGGWTPVTAIALYAGVSIVASWAVTFRRLHDFGVHGREVLLPLLCTGAVIGIISWRTGWAPPATLWIVTDLVFHIPLIVIPGAPGANEFGPPSQKTIWREAQRDAP